MKRYGLLIIFSLVTYSLKAQHYSVDSLQRIIKKQRYDSAEVNALLFLSINTISSTDGISYAKQALLLSEKNEDKRGEANSHLVLAELLGSMSNTVASIQHGLTALSIYETLKDATGMAQSHLVLQANYRDAEDFANALRHEFEGTNISEEHHVIGVFDFPDHRLAPLFLLKLHKRIS